MSRGTVNLLLSGTVPFCLAALLFKILIEVAPSLQSLQVWMCKALQNGRGENWGVHCPVRVGCGFQ